MIKLDLHGINATEKDVSYFGNLGKVKNLKVLELFIGLNYSQKINFLRMEIRYEMVEEFCYRITKHQTRRIKIIFFRKQIVY